MALIAVILNGELDKACIVDVGCEREVIWPVECSGIVQNSVHSMSLVNQVLVYELEQQIVGWSVFACDSHVLSVTDDNLQVAIQRRGIERWLKNNLICVFEESMDRVSIDRVIVINFPEATEFGQIISC